MDHNQLKMSSDQSSFEQMPQTQPRAQLAGPKSSYKYDPESDVVCEWCRTWHKLRNIQDHMSS